MNKKLNQTNKPISFIIPTYPPHFEYARQLLATFYANNLDKQADVYFCFTNEEESVSFGDYSNKIILPKELRLFHNKGIINIKKLYSLKKLKGIYDFYIVLDSEIEFIKNVDLLNICKKIYSEKQLFGNTIWNFEEAGVNLIKQQCRSHFLSNSNLDYLVAEEKNLYLWFSNLPVYKDEYLEDFFSVINYEKCVFELKDTDFDHYIYMYYLVLYRDFKIIDLKMHGFFGAGESIPEAYCFVPYTNLNHKFNMCAKSTLNLLDNDELFVVIQIDRNLRRLFFLIGHILSDLTNKYDVAVSDYTRKYNDLLDRIEILTNKKKTKKRKFISFIRNIFK